MPLKHPIKIGSSKFASNVFLAPLSGCTDLAFRLIAREHGADLCFFEMIDAHSVIYGPAKKTLSILKTAHEDAPIAAQLLGGDPAIMLDAAGKLLDLTRISFLDINAACPVKKVLKKQAGSYLLKEPRRLFSIIEKLAQTLPVPVTVKIRTGYDATDNAAIPSIARQCARSGAAAIFVHGRTRLQGYAGDVDYETIRRIKDAVDIPVFGSGNVLSAELAKRMFDETGCDGIMVARGSFGNPWIFREIDDYLCLGRIPAGPASKKSVLKRHLAYIEKYKDCSAPGKTGFMRKVALWYLKKFENAKKIRGKVALVKSYDEMIQLIENEREG